LLLIDDDGPGLARELRELAFTVGERLDDAKPGTGLGLAIVRDLVFLYGGTITLDDSPLGGLRASLSLRTVEAL
jgi:signal transduction histidine kinase